MIYQSSLIDHWHRHFGLAPTDLRRVLSVAIEEDYSFLRVLQDICPESEKPFRRRLAAWLNKNEDNPFLDSAGRPYRFARTPQGWALRPARALVPEAAD